MAEKISKQEAVRRALAHFGNDAKPAQMKPWIKAELGIEMSTDHISTAKGDILRKAGLKGRRSPKRAAKAPARKSASKAVPPPAPPAHEGPKPAAAKAGDIPLDDILYVKELVGRVGPEQLHRLIDAFK
jgi:hypothetical protein